MSDFDKLQSFGVWLMNRRTHLSAELYALSVSTRHTESAIRVKAGHLEAIIHALEAFTALYQGDLNKFREEYLGEHNEEEDGPSESAS